MENLFLLSIELNTDIFETNIINIVLLVALLVNVIGTALKNSMLERKTKILNEVQGAEQSLNAAIERLGEAEKQSEQSALIIKKIEEKTETLKEQISSSNASRLLEEIAVLNKSSRLALQYEQQKLERNNQNTLLQDGLTNAYTFIKNELEFEDFRLINQRKLNKINESSLK